MSTYKQVFNVEDGGVIYRVAECTDVDFDGIEVSAWGDSTHRTGRVLLPVEVADQVASAILRREVLRTMHRGTRVIPPRIGARVRITGVMDDPDPLPVGLEGTVDWIGQWTSRLTERIEVEWDNGRKRLLLSHDPFEVLPDAGSG